MNIMWRAQEAGLGISYEVSCGNEADLDATDFMRFLIDDEPPALLWSPRDDPDGRKFAEVARHAADREKPIVMLKFGRTDAGRRAARRIPARSLAQTKCTMRHSANMACCGSGLQRIVRSQRSFCAGANGRAATAAPRCPVRAATRC